MNTGCACRPLPLTLSGRRGPSATIENTIMEIISEIKKCSQVSKNQDDNNGKRSMYLKYFLKYQIPKPIQPNPTTLKFQYF